MGDEILSLFGPFTEKKEAFSEMEQVGLTGLYIKELFECYRSTNQAAD